MTLSTEEATVCRNIPICGQLDGFRNDFRSTFPTVDSDGFGKVVRSVASDEVARNLTTRLFAILLSIPTVMRLPSRRSSETLFHDLLRILPLVTSPLLNFEATTVLLERVIRQAPDDNIWCAVYDLVTPTTPPLTPRTILSGVADTPHSFGSGAVYNTEERRKDMDSVIKNEMKDHIYLDIPNFFPALFDSIQGLPDLANAVFARCQRSGSYSESGRWKMFPESCLETDVAAWFIAEVDNIVQFALEEASHDVRTDTLKSRRVVSMPKQPVRGSTATRKLDIGFAVHDRSGDAEVVRAGSRSVPVCQWQDILVAGELKKERAEDRKPGTWYDLGRYVREVYTSQDTRRFCHGFTLCGDLMRVWRYDRGGIYTAPTFNINGDGRRFVTVVLGYLLMGEQELGYDTTIARDGARRYISVKLPTGEERFFIEKVMHRQACIIGRATTCWKATLDGTDTSFVIKDSWQYEEKCDEGELLMEITKAGVQHVAPCYHHSAVRIGNEDDDLRGCVRKGIDVATGRKWNSPKDRTGDPDASNQGTNSSSLHKRVASAILDSDRSLKRSRSNTQGDNGGSRDSWSQNRIHKRVVMSQCGKQLFLARTKVGLIKALIGGISGHQNLFQQCKVLHRDISIGNVLITEEEDKGFLIDLDHAINVDRQCASGAIGRTGTKAFMSIGLLRGNAQTRRPHSFMDDLESIFWLLFWICIHYSGPDGERAGTTDYEDWNFRSPNHLSNEKAGVVGNEQDFLERIGADFTSYFSPLVPWVNELRREVFPGGFRWSKEDLTLYDRMKEVLRRATEDPVLKDDWPAEDGVVENSTANHRYPTRRKGAIEALS